MATRFYVYIALLLLAGAFAGGYYLGHGRVETVIKETEGKERVVYKDRIVTVTRVVKPDGTVTETTRTEDRSGSRDTETTGRDSSTKPALADYSLGAGYVVRSVSSVGNTSLSAFEIRGGRRVLGDIWGEIGLRNDSLALGVRYEW